MFISNNINEDLYDKNEAIFYTLINHTKTNDDLKKMGIEVNSFTGIMRDIFTSKPNQKNLREFFKN